MRRLVFTGTRFTRANVLLPLYHCFTTALLLLVSDLCVAWSLLVLDSHVLMLYYRYTTALLMLYYCITAAGVIPIRPLS